jgi:replicative DNA helicase
VNELDTILSAAASANVPPHALEAERAVLGALLIDPAMVNDAIGLPLSPDDFYRDAHQRIYRAILSLNERGERPDSVTLSDELEKRGELESIGGRAELARIFDYGVTTANLDSHARIVIDKALLRRLIKASQEISREATSGRDEVRDVLDRAEARIFAITDRKVRKDIFRMRDLTAPAIEELQRLHQLKSRITGLATGLHDLDEMTGGFQPGELIVVAGRPSMGKTAFCLNIAENAAIKLKKPVAVFSLEMSKEQLVLRMLASRSEINLRQLRTGYIGDDWSRLTKATGELHSAPIWIDDTPGLSVLELRAKARRIRSEEPLSLIVVDYLQLMRGPDSLDSRQQEISHITRSLKGLAKELSVPIIALSQLSRQPEMRGPKGLPMLSDLRESGAIEQDADVVLFVYRAAYYQPDPENPDKDRVATIKVAKQRNGPTGDIEVTFLKEFASFRNASRLSPDDYRV